MQKKLKSYFSFRKNVYRFKRTFRENPDESTLLVAVERLYPFPEEEIKEVLESLPNLEKYHGFKKNLKPRRLVICLSLS